MGELHLVGSTDDGRHLLLAATPGGTGEFRLAADERLAGVLRARPRPAEPVIALSPRQIQAELRAGTSLEDVAARAGVPLHRLDRYAAPVLSELARVLEDALAARMSRPQHGPSLLSLGHAVGARLARAEGRPEPRWSARRDPDASWVVELRYAGKAGEQVACWRWDRGAHSLAPLDAAAAELGHVARPAEQQAARVAPTDEQRAAPGAAEPQAAPVAAEPTPPPRGEAATAEAPQPPHEDVGRRPAEAARPSRGGRPGRRPAVPAWADVLLGVTSSGPDAAAVPPQDAEAAG